MDALFGTELSLPVKFIGAFLAVLAAIALAAYLVRRFGVGALAGKTQRNRQQRLAVIDSADIDIRRKLIIVRRDNVEHLLLIGGPTDVLVESNIVRAAAVQAVRETPVRTATVEPPAPLAADGSWPHAVATAPAPQHEPPPRPLQFTRPEPALRPAPSAHPEPFILPELRREPTPVKAPQPVQIHPEPPSAPPPPPWMQPAETASTRPAPERPVPERPVAEATRVSIEPLHEPPPVVTPPVPRDLDIVPEVKAEAPVAPAVTPPQPPIRSAQVSLRGVVNRSEKVEPLTSSEEQNLADMAQRLEAALRRPLAAGGTPRPAPTVTAPQRPAPQRPGANGQVPTQRTEPPTYENLQREMANLLGRQSGSS
jgi:flagellar biogenesis protein FliO